MVQYLQILLNARFAKMEERGATAVEYGLLIALIAGLIVVALLALGPKLQDAFQGVSDKIPAGGTGS